MLATSTSGSATRLVQQHCMSPSVLLSELSGLRPTGTGNLRLLRIALLIWPLITGVPAFVVALVLTTVLVRVQRRRAGHTGPIACPTQDSFRLHVKLLSLSGDESENSGF